MNVHNTHRPQRSSSQPDLLALDMLAGTMRGHGTSAFHSTMDNMPYSNSVGAGAGSTARDQNWSVIRVWRAGDAGRDQTSKLVLLPRKQTNAMEATRLALEEFGLSEDELESYCLYHVTVESGPIVKQSRLANTTDDLPGRLTLNARYYLKHNRYHDPLVADDVARNILTESRVTFMQSTEYIDEVFGLTAASEACLTAGENGISTQAVSPPTGYATGHENLDRFTELVNREAYWAPTEICNENNLNRRVDLLKRFIKVNMLRTPIPCVAHYLQLLQLPDTLLYLWYIIGASCNLPFQALLLTPSVRITELSS
ncbi:unnamed protein product [Echinostoma caproni]|uniref:Ras-GEF domain-containing protein n=1 Tax=Echinostoma caproni TaxID=27848 RepID=A0A3P8GZW0_9TREM|nr:unnamed protein product [Echinostoma caproni]